MPDLERVQQNTPTTLSQQWWENGVAVDPGTVTVGITRADGTELVAAGTATTGSGTGVRSFNLTTTHTALLDRLTVTWTSSSKGTLVSYLEVVGGFLFTLNQARAYTPLNDTVKYTTARLVEMRTHVEMALEQACGVAFVPRYERERIAQTRPWSTTELGLRWPKVREIRDATIDGTALDTAALDTVVPSGSFFYYSSGWTSRNVASDITVGYEHGYDFAPPRVSQAAILLAKRWLVAGPIDDRTTSMSTEDGTFTLATPGVRGSVFGIPEVDAVVEQHGFLVIV